VADIPTYPNRQGSRGYAVRWGRGHGRGRWAPRVGCPEKGRRRWPGAATPMVVTTIDRSGRGGWGHGAGCRLQQAGVRQGRADAFTSSGLLIQAIATPIMLAIMLAIMKMGPPKIANPLISLEPARGVEPRAC
jgi:hypothetical protein